MKLLSKHLSIKILAISLAVILLGSLCGCGSIFAEKFDEEAERAELYEMGLEPHQLEWNIIQSKLRDRIRNAKGTEVLLSRKGAITDVSETGGEVTGFTLNVSKTAKIPFEAKGVTINEDGSLRIAENGYICSLKEIAGLYGLGLKGAEDYYGVEVYFAVSPADDSQVTSSEELLFTTGLVSDLNTEDYLDFENPGQFGFIKVQCAEGNGDLSIASFRIFEDGEHHGIGTVALYTNFYGWLREGDFYDFSRESFAPDEGIFDFYLLCYSDIEGAEHDVNLSGCIAGITDYVIGDLHAADGSVKLKTAPLALGDYLDVTIKGETMKVDLPICCAYSPNTLFEGSTTSNFPSKGDLNVLVVPVYFADQVNHLSSDRDMILDVLGNVVLADGTAENHSSGDGYFTMSDYFSKTSYGKLNITSYVTDWYLIPEYDYADRVDDSLRNEETVALQSWVNEKYSGWRSKLDSNGDDIFDAVIVVCASTGYERESYATISLGGAVTTTRAYGHWYAHDGEAAINEFVQISADMFYQRMGDSSSGLCSNVLVHEMGHGFGLIDFYDVYYSGFDAVGSYDMQSQNVGDWNPYSKFAAGWTTPTVLTAEEIGDGTRVTLSRFTQSGDTLVIPTEKTERNADGSISPFNEYIMVDLFSPDGLNAYDAPKFALTESGVRIYHVDSRLLKIDYEKDWGEAGTTYDVLYTNAYQKNGKFHINLLQSRGENTFTAGEYRQFRNEDLFKEGDLFSMEKQAYAFKDGRMNDGSEFPYSITVISLTDDEAILEIKPATR